jgi:hypothetical protein
MMSCTMLDFQDVREGRMTVDELSVGLTVADLRRLTSEMLDAISALVANCTDADVVFEPVDPVADDPYAGTPEEVRMPWTLGHIIVHTTASAEESAALAAELARGVPFHGSSRYETPWTALCTVAGLRQRLAESRRMRLASLEMWPDAAHLENRYQAWTDGPVVNAVGRFLLGLMHEDDHLAQISEIVRQARAA